MPNVTYDKRHAVSSILTAAVGRYRFVNYSGAHATSSTDCQGISEQAGTVGKAISLVTAYSYPVEAAEAISAGAYVKPAADGTGRAAVGTSSDNVGRALNAAVAGDPVTVRFIEAAGGAVSGAAKTIAVAGGLTAAHWTVFGAANGTATNPADDPVRGQVLNIAVTNVGAKVAFRRDLGLSFEARGGLELWLKRDANLTVLDLNVYCEKYDKTVSISWNKGMGGFDAGRWVRFAVPLSEFEAKTAGMTAASAGHITGLNIGATAATGQTTTLQVAGLTAHEVPAGSVTFLFDDARLDTYTDAFRIMRGRGFVGSVAAEFQRLGTTPSYALMTEAQLAEMYAAGWDVLGHHVSQMPTLTEAQQVAIYQAQREWARARGYRRGEHIWVWPGGQADAASEAYAGRYYQVMRRTTSPTNVGIPGVFDPTCPAIKYITSGTTVAAILALVDKVAEFGGNVTFVFHSLVPASKVAAEDFLVGDFDSVCEGVTARGVTVIPSSQVWPRVA